MKRAVRQLQVWSLVRTSKNVSSNLMMRLAVAGNASTTTARRPEVDLVVESSSELYKNHWCLAATAANGAAILHSKTNNSPIKRGPQASLQWLWHLATARKLRAGCHPFMCNNLPAPATQQKQPSQQTGFCKRWSYHQWWQQQQLEISKRTYHS